jgi:hypothetical protein
VAPLPAEEVSAASCDDSMTGDGGIDSLISSAGADFLSGGEGQDFADLRRTDARCGEFQPTFPG